MPASSAHKAQALALLLQLVYGRRTGWLTLGDPAWPVAPPCPRCKKTKVRAHRKGRAPVIDYRCRGCKKVFNCWKGTVFEGTHRDPVELLRLLDAVVRKEKNADIARRFGWQRAWVIEIVRRLGNEPFVRQLRGDFGGKSENYNGLWPSDFRKFLSKLDRAERAQQESEGRT